MTKAETAILICGVCSPLGLYIAQPILPQIAGSFTLSPGQAGFAVAAPTFALALAAPLIGSVSDRVGRLPMIIGALVLSVLPTLLAAQAGSFIEVLLWEVLLGFLTPAISAVALAYVGDEFSPERGARLTALFISANVTGGFIGRYVSAVAAGQYSWRMSFVAVAVLQCLGCASVATPLPRSENFKHSHNLSTALTSMARHVTNPALGATFVVGFGVLFCIGASSLT